MRFIILFNLIFLSFSQAAYKMDLVVGDLGIVWGMDFLNEKTLIFTERSGKIKILNLENKKIEIIRGGPSVFSRGQGGLLDLKLHPQFSQNKKVYLTYSKIVGDSKTTALGYGILENNELKNFKDILIGKGEASSRLHFGSRIAFDENNKIFFSIGERGERDNAQILTNHFGKILRLNDDGTVPEDNPFVGKKDALPEIWSYGHRNPQGLVYDRDNKILYEMEHGPRGGDEINIIEKAKNYGWPLQSYGDEYFLPLSVGEKKVSGTVQPLKYYVPSIAPCGLVLYRGERYVDLKDSLISGALKLTHLNVYNLKTTKETRLFENNDLRVRTVAISPDDFIYFSTDDGQIYKLIH